MSEATCLISYSSSSVINGPATWYSSSLSTCSSCFLYWTSSSWNTNFSVSSFCLCLFPTYLSMLCWCVDAFFCIFCWFYIILVPFTFSFLARDCFECYLLCCIIKLDGLCMPYSCASFGCICGIWPSEWEWPFFFWGMLYGIPFTPPGIRFWL